MFTPQRRVLGMWFRIARAQPTMQAASEIIRQKMKAAHPRPAPPAPSPQPQQKEVQPQREIEPQRQE